jgi:hypothetical protein
MGILDDAIREHLELKRQHGVPEEELQRQEEEALGPARRDVAQQHEEHEPAAGQTATAEADEPVASQADQETAFFDMEGDGAADAHPSAEAPAVGEAEATHVEPPPVEPPRHDFEVEAEEEVEDEDEAAEEEPEAGEQEPEDEDLLSAEEEAGAEEGDPDVLEDTPDFLQEAPEHDRLWFEQKPPRDFDFD